MQYGEFQSDDTVTKRRVTLYAIYAVSKKSNANNARSVGRSSGILWKSGTMNASRGPHPDDAAFLNNYGTTKWKFLAYG